MSAHRDADHPARSPDPAATLGGLRRALLVLLLVGLLGTALELLLMEHIGDWWQRIPLLLIGAALLVLVWYGIGRAPASIQALRIVMLLFLASAAGGVVLHTNGNREFALETTPTLAGREVIVEMLTGAFPALAPGSMALLGLLGLLFTWRHPALTSR